MAKAWEEACHKRVGGARETRIIESIGHYSEYALNTAFLSQIKSAVGKVDALTPSKPQCKPLIDVGLLHIWNKAPFPSRVDGDREWRLTGALGKQDTRQIKVLFSCLSISLAPCLVGRILLGTLPTHRGSHLRQSPSIHLLHRLAERQDLQGSRSLAFEEPHRRAELRWCLSSLRGRPNQVRGERHRLPHRLRLQGPCQLPGTSSQVEGRALLMVG